MGNDRHPLLSMETISGNGRRLDGGCGIGAYDRMLLFDKKEVIAWNMVNFRSVNMAYSKDGVYQTYYGSAHDSDCGSACFCLSVYYGSSAAKMQL